MVRDFVYGCWCNGRRIGGMEMPPLNELYAASHARQEGLETVLLDAQVEPERFKALLSDRLAGYLALVLMSSTQSFRHDLEVLARVKAAAPGIRTVLFGSHPTFMPRYALEPPQVDYIVQREPEETIRRLLGRLARGEDPAGLKGIGFRDPSGRIRLNPPRPFVDLDHLALPDRTLLPRGIDYFNPVVRRMPYTTIQTSRGCPGRCIFCTAPEFYGRRIRVRSTEGVMEELSRIKAAGFREVFFRDETFTAYRDRNRELCRAMIRERLDLAWIANGRVDMIDPEDLKLMRRAGCHLIKFGLESGCDELLQAYRKGTTAAQAERAFAAAREAGLEIHAHLIFGGPGESLATIGRTLDFVKKLQPTTASFGILTPYPGTELFDRVAEARPEIRDGSGSNMDNLHVQGFFSEVICGLPAGELSRAVTRAYRRFYWRPPYLWERLTSVRSRDRLMVLLLAGLNIFRFSLTGEK